MHSQAMCYRHVSSINQDSKTKSHNPTNSCFSKLNLEALSFSLTTWVPVPFDSMVERGRESKKVVERNRKVFDFIELPERLKVKYVSYLLIGNAKSKWHTLLVVHHGSGRPT